VQPGTWLDAAAIAQIHRAEHANEFLTAILHTPLKGAKKGGCELLNGSATGA
jgi:hypothetical protein